MRTLLLAGAFATLLPLGGYAQTTQELENGATDTKNVLNYGMGYHLQRFSTLKQIDEQSVKRLDPGVELQLRRQPRRGIPAAGLQRRAVRDDANATMAVDVRTGKQIWKSKVEYPPERRASSAAASSTAAARSTRASCSAPRSTPTSSRST